MLGCWGQMSYWGITVMINIVAVLPCCGIIIAKMNMWRWNIRMVGFDAALWCDIGMLGCKDVMLGWWDVEIIRL